MLVFLAAIRLLVLPVQGGDVCAQVAATAEEVLAEMPGLELIRWTELPAGLAAKAQAIRSRCGDQRDCQLKIGRLLRANLMLLLEAKALGEGALAEFDFVDLGTKRSKRKLSRSLAGSPEHRRDVLEHILTDTLFPERMVGRIDIRLHPASAEIFLDDQLKLRDAPAQVSLENIREGRHTLRITKPGHKDFIAIIQVPFKGVSVLDVRLRPDP